MSATPTPPPAAPQGQGLAPNVAGGLAYVTCIPAIIFLLIDPYRRDAFVRFHSFQSLFLCAASIICWIVMMVLDAVLWHIPVLGWIVSITLHVVIGIGFLVMWLMAMIKAFGGQSWKIPFIGNIAAQQAGGGGAVTV